MKKLLLISLTAIITICSYSQNYAVYGAGDSLANGLYAEMGINEGHPWYQKGNYYMIFTQYIGCMPKWVILKDSVDMIYKNYNILSNPPSCFWEMTCNQNSVQPPPVVLPEGCAVIYSHEYIHYEERIVNDGGIDNSNPLKIMLNRYNGEIFTGSNGDDFYANGKVSISGYSNGLTPKVEKINDTLLHLTFLGNALNHQDNDDVYNISFILNNQAFSSGDTSQIMQTMYQNIYLNFKQPDLTYMNTYFTEDSSDIGTIKSSSVCSVLLSDFGCDSFNGTPGENFIASGKATILSMPNGLIPMLEFVQNNKLELRIVDTAYQHSNSNNTFIELILFDNAFLNYDASEYLNPSCSSLYINFIQLISVETSNHSDILFYPNPVSTLLYVKNLPVDEPVKMLVYNSAGQPVIQQSFGDCIDVSGLTKGNYILVISDKRNSFSYKFVIN